MRKLALLVVLLLLAVSVSASQGDALLTPDGTLHTIEVEVAASTDVTTATDAHLVLTSRRGTESKRETIPATLSAGSHLDPAMAFDAESGMLFVFWMHRETLMGSELLFASRDANGVWSEATQFGGRLFDLRENLRIAVTRKYFDVDENATKSGITVHAAWWEWDTHLGEWFAQYQMLTIENGRVAEPPAPLDLRQLAREAGIPAATEQLSLDVLRHPLLFTSPKQDSVFVVYGDVQTQQLHEVRVSPSKIASQGRLRVPVGRREGGSNTPRLAIASSSRMDGVFGDNDRMAFFTTDKDALRYVVMKNGVWSEQQQIALDSQITAGAAVDALRRLVNEH